MKNTTVVRHLRSLLAHLRDNDFSTSSQDKALAIAVAQLGEKSNRDRLTNFLHVYETANKAELNEAIAATLADLRHIAEAFGLDFAHLDALAYSHYVEEGGSVDEPNTPRLAAERRAQLGQLRKAK